MQSLTEKWRPGSLSEVVGQSAAVAQLQSFVDAAKADGNGRGAFILSGPSGVGKTSAAWAMAFDLGCDREDPEMGGVHDIASGKQDGQAVEKLLRDLSGYPMYGSGWKVAIINEADKMTAQAEAIWLDGLEKLPNKTVVIFTTNDLAKFNARFFSRCESVEFTGDPVKINGEFSRYVRKVYHAETGKKLRTIPQGLGVFDIAGGTLSFRLALQQLAPYCRSGAKLPEAFQPPIVRDSDTGEAAKWREAGLKAAATRRAKAGAA